METSVNQQNMQTTIIPFNQRTGYACINMTLAKAGIMTNRDCVLKTFKNKGLNHVSKLALANVIDLEKIIRWNSANGFKFYRISSSLFPWMTEYEFEELVDWPEIAAVLQRIGKYVERAKQRLEFHPSHFIVLASPNEDVVAKGIKDLNQHSKIFDTMGLTPSHWNPLNIHIGGAYGDKAAAAARWCKNFNLLSESARKRIVVENDDKANMYSVKDLYDLVYSVCKVPITFDIFHHTFCTGGLSNSEAAKLAASTWEDAPLVIHWSSSMKMHENAEAKSVAHADYIYDEFTDWDTDGWFMCESKAKELSVLEYWESGPRASL